MTSLAKISIIIPAYNAANTISRCIESVKRQCYNNWELIIVDDGSSDQTSEICKDYAESDNRIKYFRQQNGGAAKARNVGIDFAKGDYVSFLDADDTYESDFLCKMLEAIESTHADMGICDFYIVDKGLKTEVHQPINKNVIDTPNGLREYIRLFFHGNPGGIASLWNKIYKRDIIERSSLRLDPNKNHGEDWKFNLQLLCGGYIKIVGIDKPLYNYIKQPNSLSTQFSMDKINQMFESAQFMLDINNQFELNEDKSVLAGIICGYVGIVKNIYSRSLLNKLEQEKLIGTLNAHPLMQKAAANIHELPLPWKFKVLYLLLQVRIVGPHVFRILNKLK